MGETAWSDFHYSSTDGLRLHARVYGADNKDALPVVCLPGLTRNARDFHELAVILSRDTDSPRQVIAFDYRGRGGSDHDPNWRNYDVAMEATDVSTGLTILGVERAAFIGTSRGGLVIFTLAAMRPALLAAVVLNDVGPVIEGAGLAQIRSFLTRAPKPKSFAEAIALQRSANGEAFPALGSDDWERIVRALYREEKGRPVADFDPALVNTVKSVDLGKPLPALWAQFAGIGKVPVLAIRGANSRLLSAETLDEMRRRHPDIETVTVDGQGHAPLLETDILPERIAAFLGRAEKKASREISSTRRP